jgi:hypothetical protein
MERSVRAEQSPEIVGALSPDEEHCGERVPGQRVLDAAPHSKRR